MMGNNTTEPSATAIPLPWWPLSFLALGVALFPFVVQWGAFSLSFSPPTGLSLSFQSVHVVTEMFAVLVSLLLFSTGFHIPEKRRPLAPIVLAAAFLGVGLLDFLHLLSYPGMADFITPNTPQKTLVLWLAARLLAAVAMAAYVMLPAVPLSGNLSLRPLLLSASLLYALIWGYVGIWQPDLLPLTYDPASGLTTFKIGAEWLVIALLGIALVWSVARGDDSGQWRQKSHLMALALMIGSEFWFTLYREMTDTLNMMGHLYKVAAYLLVYRAIFLQSVRLPIIRLDQTREALAQSEKEWRDTFDAITDPVFIHDADHRIVRCNLAYTALAGLEPVAIPGRRYYEVFPLSAEPPLCCRQALERRECVIEDTYVPEVDRHYNVHFIPVSDGQGSYRHSLHVMNDITLRKRHEEELRYRATHDPLTGLPNRALFLDRLRQALAQAQRTGKLVVVIFLDLDNFRAVNNSYGHTVGDVFLKKSGERFRAVLRETDTVARLGGDEFAILLPEFDAIEKTAQIVEKINGTFATPIRLENRLELYNGASIGIAFFPQDGADEHTLVRHADLAMYQAKAAGRGTWAFFAQETDQRLHEDVRLHGRLKHALASGGLTLHYQPQVKAANREVVGAEALLRWRDDELGDVSPARFIPVAEATGLIHLIDEWVLETACRQIAAWHRQGKPLKVAINVSAIQFRRPDFVELVRSRLHASGAPPHLLSLEVTETTAMTNMALAKRHLEEVVALGVRVSLDDFGTGHSSLAYLKSLPIDELKIDRSFIRDIAREEDDEVIIQAIIGLAHNLNIRVVAEGVENEAQLGFLLRHGCDFCQGWYFSRDMSAAELEERFLASGA